MDTPTAWTQWIPPYDPRRADGRVDALQTLVSEAEGRLEGLPSVGQDEASLTVLTRHFSPIVVGVARTRDLDRLSRDTRFKPGVDAWQIPNTGSYVAPRGVCLGMTRTALWYYLEELPATGQHLYLTFDNSLGQGYQTPDYTGDDDAAYKLVSAVQAAHVRPRLEISAWPGGLTDGRLQFYMAAKAISTTNRPQLLTVFASDGKSAHSVICYRLEGHTLWAQTFRSPTGTLIQQVVDVEEGWYPTGQQQ